MTAEPVDLAIDLGGTRVRAAAVTRDMRLVGRVEEPSAVAGGPRETVAQIVRLGTAALDSAGAGRARRVVASTPGPLDTVSGVVFDPPNLPGWHRVPFQEWLEDGFGTFARIVNDANAAALGEFAAGAGRGSLTMVYFTISTGIGGGVIVDGRVLEGSSGIAGELGHTTVDIHGPRCPCGNIGCLEALASGLSIARRFNDAVAAGQSSRVADGLQGKPATAVDVVRGVREGDELAAAIFGDAMRAIGAGVVNAIHTFNPEVVVLGGGVTKAGDLLFAPVRAWVEAYAMAASRAGVRLMPAELADDAGLYGCAVIASRWE